MKVKQRRNDHYLWPATQCVEHVKEHKTSKRHRGVAASDFVIGQLK